MAVPSASPSSVVRADDVNGIEEAELGSSHAKSKSKITGDQTFNNTADLGTGDTNETEKGELAVEDHKGKLAGTSIHPSGLGPSIGPSGSITPPTAASPGAETPKLVIVHELALPTPITPDRLTRFDSFIPTEGDQAAEDSSGDPTTATFGRGTPFASSEKSNGSTASVAKGFGDINRDLKNVSGSNARDAGLHNGRAGGSNNQATQIEREISIPSGPETLLGNLDAAPAPTRAAAHDNEEEPMDIDNSEDLTTLGIPPEGRLTPESIAPSSPIHQSVLTNLQRLKENLAENQEQKDRYLSGEPASYHQNATNTSLADDRYSSVRSRPTAEQFLDRNSAQVIFDEMVMEIDGHAAGGAEARGGSGLSTASSLKRLADRMDPPGVSGTSLPGAGNAYANGVPIDVQERFPKRQRHGLTDNLTDLYKPGATRADLFKMDREPDRGVERDRERERDRDRSRERNERDRLRREQSRHVIQRGGGGRGDRDRYWETDQNRESRLDGNGALRAPTRDAPEHGQRSIPLMDRITPAEGTGDILSRRRDDRERQHAYDARNHRGDASRAQAFEREIKTAAPGGRFGSTSEYSYKKPVESPPKGLHDSLDTKAVSERERTYKPTSYLPPARSNAYPLDRERERDLQGEREREHARDRNPDGAWGRENSWDRKPALATAPPPRGYDQRALGNSGAGRGTGASLPIVRGGDDRRFADSAIQTREDARFQMDDDKRGPAPLAGRGSIETASSRYGVRGDPHYLSSRPAPADSAYGVEPRGPASFRRASNPHSTSPPMMALSRLPDSTRAAAASATVEGGPRPYDSPPVRNMYDRAVTPSDSAHHSGTPGGRQPYIASGARTLNDAIVPSGAQPSSTSAPDMYGGFRGNIPRALPPNNNREPIGPAPGAALRPSQPYIASGAGGGYARSKDVHDGRAFTSSAGNALASSGYTARTIDHNYRTVPDARGPVQPPRDQTYMPISSHTGTSVVDAELAELKARMADLERLRQAEQARDAAFRAVASAASPLPITRGYMSAPKQSGSTSALHGSAPYREVLPPSRDFAARDAPSYRTQPPVKGQSLPDNRYDRRVSPDFGRPPPSAGPPARTPLPPQEFRRDDRSSRRDTRDVRRF